MKLLRHILSHFLLISFLIAVVSVFYYRTLLLPDNVVSKVDEVVNDVYPPALAFVSNRENFWSIKGERIVSFDDLNLFKKDDVASVKEENTTIVVKDDSNSSIEKEMKIITKGEKVAITPEKNEKDTGVVTTKTDEKPTTNADAKPAAEPKVLEKIIVEVKDSDTSSERNLFIDARTAFNTGNISTSEKLYLELTQLEQDNADAFGELGNVYYSQGKWDQAGQAYYEAAVRLIAEGNYNQVSYLQRVISGLNTEHADKLSQLMMRR